MAQDQTQTIPRDKFLTMSVNLLYKAFLESRRTEAKNVFRDMLAGKSVHLTNVQMEDKSQVRFDIALDHSEYPGKLNFGGFRASLAMLISQLSEALRAEQDIKVFTAEENPDVIIFGVTGVTYEDDQASVLVLGADSSESRGAIELRLQYLDPAQFAPQPAAGEEPAQA
ncbi:hypothetical protein CWI75_09355 [Kineobactrum sediminis]|uniref:Uncharacterized protein n=1 Tax=Kineobactrum sediminis TaxID=1905677 RepID=A0A2N5Y311_9GAMM|nr:hypothetical protein [Kineobactrum sediminis]PLW82768.1 hypothetical protein CWI75_09355 [Kineobactrum sediminis]